MLLDLSRNRWMIGLMAGFAGGTGARLAELLARTGAPRDSVVRTIEVAIGLGWIVRNPGYGHPLRPEYLLTPQGEVAALHAHRLSGALSRCDVAATGLTRWSLGAVAVIDRGAQRFNAVQRALAPASPRAVSQTLQHLIGQSVIHRDVADGFPPTSLYGLTEKGRILAQAM